MNKLQEADIQKEVAALNIGRQIRQLRLQRRLTLKEVSDITGLSKPALSQIETNNGSPPIATLIKIATALADAFECGVNDLPLSMILSWYEQKAVAILLTLLYLGIKDIRLGPSLPAFVTPNVLDVLVDKFNIMPVSEPEQDLQAILG